MVRNGVERLGSAAAFFAVGATELSAVRGIGRERATRLLAALHGIDWQAEMELAERNEVKLLTFVDREYPSILKKIHDPPLVLYVRGDVAVLNNSGIAVVGTRAPTHYGRETARRMAFQIAQAGYTVVSGLARGVDAEAHRAALQARGRTVAVLGSALDKLYPYENRELAVEIAGSGGAVITEYPFGRQADRQTFPMRNRIVSGLSAGVLVVEAGLTSGTLITADQALEQGRSVMAIPGRIDSTASQGCHRLLRQGARLVESLDDILDEVQSLPGMGTFRSREPEQRKVAPEPILDEIERALLDALGEGELSVEALIQRSGLSAGIVGARLMGLEMKRLVRRLPGHMLTAVRP